MVLFYSATLVYFYSARDIFRRRFRRWCSTGVRIRWLGWIAGWIWRSTT